MRVIRHIGFILTERDTADESRWLPLARLILLAHLGVTLALAYNLNIWLDEAFTLDTTSRGLAYAFRRALDFELQPPLYFSLLSLWRQVDDSVFFARLPSVFAVAATIRLAASLARRYIKNLDQPVFVAFIALVAFNPFMIWAATEARLYAFVLLFSAVLLVTFHDGFLKEKVSRRAQILYALTATLALYTQYYIGFLLVANACALLASRRWRPLRNYVWLMCAVGVTFAPMLVTVISQVATHTRGYGDPLSIIESINVIYWRTQEYLLPVAWSPLYFWRRWLLRFGVVAFAALVWKRRRSLPSELRAVWVTALMLAASFVVVASRTPEALMQERHTAALFFPIILAVVSLVCVINKKAISAWLLLSALFYLTTLGITYAPVAKRGDWIRVATYLMAAEQPGQMILVFSASSALPLGYYYKGVNHLTPLHAGYEHGSDTSTPLDERQIGEALRSVSPDAEQVWLVTDWTCEGADAPVDCIRLKKYLFEQYHIESSRVFHHSEVTRLRRKRADE